MATERMLCTNQVLQKATGCVKCLSRKELFAVLVVIMAGYNGYSLPTDNQELLEDLTCFKCGSDRERLNGTMAKLIERFRSEYTIDQLRAEIECIICWDEVTLKSAISLLMCQFIEDLTIIT